MDAAAAREVLKVGGDQLRILRLAHKVRLLVQYIADTVACPVHGQVKDLLEGEDKQAEACQVPRELDGNLGLLDLFETGRGKKHMRVSERLDLEGRGTHGCISASAETAGVRQRQAI